MLRSLRSRLGSRPFRQFGLTVENDHASRGVATRHAWARAPQARPPEGYGSKDRLFPGQAMQHAAHAGFDAFQVGAALDFGGEGRLVGIMEAGEGGDFAAPGSLVQTLRIALFADR